MDPRVLQQAIYASNASHAKLILVKLCRDNPSARRYIESEMLIEELEGGKVQPVTNTDTDMDHSPTKKRARFAICAQCAQPFDETRNEELACSQPFHPGMMIENFPHSTWDEVKEDSEYFSSPGFYKDPDKFDWTCCGRPGNAEGCQVRGRHLAATLCGVDAPLIHPPKKARWA